MGDYFCLLETCQYTKYKFMLTCYHFLFIATTSALEPGHGKRGSLRPWELQLCGGE